LPAADPMTVRSLVKPSQQTALYGQASAAVETNDILWAAASGRERDLQSVHRFVDLCSVKTEGRQVSGLEQFTTDCFLS
jgi:hypothetical protein